LGGGTTSQIGGGSYNNYFDDHLSRLHADIEQTTRKLELEQRRLSRLDKDLSAAEFEYQQKRSKYKVAASSQEDAVAQKSSDVRQLERRLDLAIHEFNKGNETNDALREQIDKLRKERQLLDNVFRKMERSIRGSRRAIDDLNVEMNENKNETDGMQQKCQALGKALDRERRSFHKQTEDLKRGIDEEYEKAKEQDILSRVGGTAESRTNGAQTGPRRKAYMVADEEEAFSESAMHRRILKICFLNTIQRRHIKQHMKNIEVFEQAFATIKTTTGISDIEEIVKIFVQLEQRNFSLLTYVNQLNREIESMEIRSRELANQLAGKNAEEATSADKNSGALAEISNQIKRTKDATDEKEHDIESLAKQLEECRPYIWTIVRYLKQEIPNLVAVSFEGDVPQMKVSPPDEHDSQMNHHLTYVEEAILLFRGVLGIDARTTVQPKPPGAGIKRPNDLPVADLMRDDDDDDEDTGVESRAWNRVELREKAQQNIQRRRRKPGQQGKVTHEERAQFEETSPDNANRTQRDGSSNSKDVSTANAPLVSGDQAPGFCKSPSMVDKAGSEEAGGRDEMWWRGQGREKKK